MDRYSRVARVYDRLSAEPVYRAGRVEAVAALGLARGERVLDVGCGTGLNLPLLTAVGPTGLVVGVDRSTRMLDVARAQVRRRGWDNVRLVHADATGLDIGLDPTLGDPAGFDAVVFTYALSLMPDWPAAWHAATRLLRPGGRAAVVDMRLPQGRARILSPLARLACLLGGADINAHPWTELEKQACGDVVRRSLRGGHIQVRTAVVAPR
jgi:S-adenosylmethionine-diacylgycerolhomoserine-N-methlytransferase